MEINLVEINEEHQWTELLIKLQNFKEHRQKHVDPQKCKQQ